MGVAHRDLKVIFINFCFNLFKKLARKFTL